MADSDTPLLDRATDLGSRLQARQQSHFQVGQSQALALRAQQQVINEHVSQERFQNQQQGLELSRIRQLTEIAKERAVLQNQMQQQVQSANAITSLGSLDPNDPQYTVKMAEIFNKNPMASKDPVIESLVKSHLESRHVVETTGAHIEQTRQTEALQLQREKDLIDYKAKMDKPIPTAVRHQYEVLAGEMKSPAGKTDEEKQQFKDAKVEQARIMERDYPALVTGTQPPPVTQAIVATPDQRPKLEDIIPIEEQ